MSGTFIYQKDGAYAGFNMEHFSEFRMILTKSKEDPKVSIISLEVSLNYNATKRYLERKGQQTVYADKTRQPTHIITDDYDITRFMNYIIDNNGIDPNYSDADLTPPQLLAVTNQNRKEAIPNEDKMEEKVDVLDYAPDRQKDESQDQ